MTKQITIARPDDWHVHLREGEMLRSVARYTARLYGRALIMPNTTSPILTGADAYRYRQAVLDAAGWRPPFVPVMSIKLTMNTTAQMIADADGFRVKAVKLYPTGATTNSQDGVVLGRLDELTRAGVFAEMAERNMVLCIHGEVPASEVLDREPQVVPYIRQILDENPGLRVVVEHVSTEAMAWFVQENDPQRVACTVTAHHLYLTLDDLIGGELKPHYFCKPVVKQLADQAYLWHCVVRYPNFFFGSDSAPHSEVRKHSSSCAAGAFTSPIALPLLAQMFEGRGYIDQLQEFVSHRGAYFYGFPQNVDSITLEMSSEPVEVESIVGDAHVMPLREGDELYWRVVE